uniref:Uncharacterized protein n=1 Tax=Candidatus Kentrum sp. MB TaxID=2138164 RepID=A0A450XJ43_9GAMM|nr:MAG: hypothetical protein BECKMB1821G_GA0114241_10465 [Candidatus Kentron sp. MB]VFK34763.1 MAG: hypothetical protein BECKMB1821I_GA0114274_108316 [Candidatus Kentron sp. MB]VFK76933.1 MAG: hypothetical protein BECKMB1821H_GA0114242_108416 [Candidatus Kentron sp. MB]
MGIHPESLPLDSYDLWGSVPQRMVILQPWPAIIRAFVPFNNLSGIERQVPTESARFFRILHQVTVNGR